MNFFIDLIVKEIWQKREYMLRTCLHNGFYITHVTGRHFEPMSIGDRKQRLIM